jgi:glycosyltransferase involved in cell wall biosynthesis
MSVYNGEKYVRAAVESILCQTFRDFEFIIIDDGSTDDSARIIREYASRDSRIVFQSHSNRGLTESLNTGIASARGLYIARQDDDDLSGPDRLTLQAAVLEQNPSVVVVASAYVNIDEDGTALSVSRPPLSEGELDRRLRRRNVLAHGSLMFRKSAFDAVGGYRPAFRYAQDYDLLLRLQGRGRFRTLEAALYHLRLRQESLGMAQEQRQTYFANLARRCYSIRVAGGSDETLLKEAAERAAGPSSADGATSPRLKYLFLKALHLVKSGQRQKARDVLRQLPSGIRWSRPHVGALYALTFLPQACSTWLAAGRSGFELMSELLGRVLTNAGRR